jgi:hypothetical protein
VLVPDYVDPEQPTFMLGTSLNGVKLGLYTFSPAATGSINRQPRDITPDGNIYCSENFLSGRTAGKMPTERLNGILLLELRTEMTLRAEAQSADTCNSALPWLFTRKAVSYQR